MTDNVLRLTKAGSLMKTLCGPSPGPLHTMYVLGILCGLCQVHTMHFVETLCGISQVNTIQVMQTLRGPSQVHTMHTAKLVRAQPSPLEVSPHRKTSLKAFLVKVVHYNDNDQNNVQNTKKCQWA